MKTTSCPTLPFVLNELCVNQAKTQVSEKQNILNKLRSLPFSPFEAKVESDWVLAQRTGVLPFIPPEITEVPAWPAEATPAVQYAETIGAPCLFSIHDAETAWSDQIFYRVIAHCLRHIPETARVEAWRRRLEMHAFETTLAIGMLEEARQYGFFSAHALYCTLREPCVTTPALYAFWAAVMDFGLDFIDPSAYPILAHFEREKIAWAAILKIKASSKDPLATLKLITGKQGAVHAHP